VLCEDWPNHNFSNKLITKFRICRTIINIKSWSKIFYQLTKVPHFKQAAVIGFHSHIFWHMRWFSNSVRGLINFLDLSLVYIKLLFPINIQFSIDSFLDWEGHYWVFTILIRKPHCSRSLPQITAPLSLLYYRCCQ